jgi:hypothetical protein
MPDPVPATAPAPAAAPAPPSAEAIAAAVQAVLTRQGGDPQAALQAAIQRGLRLRARVSQLESAVPAQGSRVLTAEQAAAYDAYAALNISAPELATRITRLGELEQQVAAQELANTQREAAELVKYKPKVLSDLVAARAIKIALKDVVVDGKPAKQAVVVGEGGVETELSAWVTANAPEHLPALQETAGTASTAVFPAMPAGGAPAKTDAVSKFLAAQKAARAARSNPLIPSKS